VLVSEVPARWFAGVPEFNDRLSALAAAADNPASRTVLVDADRDYVRSLHTYDAVHPSSLGEQSLAFAALDALATIGVGSGSPATAPEVPLGPRLVPTLAGHAFMDSVILEWSANRGADRQLVWWRDVTSGSDYAIFAEPVVGTWTRVRGLTPSHRYAFVLQPAKGVHEAAADVRSNEVQVTVAAPIETPPPVPVEETPAPPTTPVPAPVPSGTASVTPHLQPTPDAARPRLRASRLPGGRVRLSWHNVTRPGPVEIQVRVAGTWLTWRVVARARDTLVTGGFSHRKRTRLRLRDSSGATSRSVIIRRP
jgi:hypothetical protein